MCVQMIPNITSLSLRKIALQTRIDPSSCMDDFAVLHLCRHIVDRNFKNTENL